jgi:hypothetical protein
MTPFEQLKKMIQDQHGMVLIGMVHQGLYGPLRDLSYILINPEPKFLNDYLTKGYEKIAIDVWKKTMLATQPMVLPMDMIDKFDELPPEFDSVREGEAYIRQKLEENPSMEEDSFYYRLGKL